MIPRTTVVTALAVTALLFPLSPAAADSMDPLMLANPCAGCHGTDGKSKGAMPTINGKSKSFIAKALRDFRDGKKPSTLMQRIAKGYSDAQIDALASVHGK